MVIRSALLSRAGFAHGFATRVGGVSAPPFDSLNLGRSVGDDLAAVEENHRRLAREVGYDVARLYETSQVHGAAVRAVSAGDDVTSVRRVEADALVAAGEGIAVGVRTADCIPVLVADEASGRVAAIHAGWRGVVANVVPRGIEALGAPASGLVCAIGPCIRAASFEVGEDVAEQIQAVARGEDVIERGFAKPHVDLVRAVIAQLAELGVARGRIEDVGGDTFAEDARFFSHRRDGGKSGRMLSVIVARG
ncbi:peptidoglycan editing factor PgeF [Sandaracinus amylolyticus]|uniref:peptidoglycan editing factor PgeF n=1 Tax=Sandaracinus amylolyticus TaxID=927083 RepID=UPI0022A74650|nr:peptidoglycan editing factor PgeF [Sandaracinus amylolyticus]